MSQQATTDARSFALEVVRRLRAGGHQALWAGGCVRDLFMGHLPKDFDVATSARPKEVQRLFPRTVAIGASFGVINVLGGNGLSVEVATFRTDGNYTDGRRPDSVQFSTPREDAQRRDFTINGMFFDPIAEEVLDYVGGKDDLERRVIRAIGNPVERFNEDRLRMLRAVRFAARFGFTIDAETFAAILNQGATIVDISAERILAELRAILEHLTRVRGVELLQQTKLLAPILPEFLEGLGHTDTAAKALGILGHWNGPIPFPLAMAGLATALPDDSAANTVEEVLLRLRSSNDDRERCAWLTQNRNALVSASTLKPHAIKRVLAEPGSGELLELMEAAELFKTDGTANVDWIRTRTLEWGQDGINPVPLLTGDDLVKLGYRPGKIFKEILDTVRDAQLDGEIHSQAEAVDMVRIRFGS